MHWIMLNKQVIDERNQRQRATTPEISRRNESSDKMLELIAIAVIPLSNYFIHDINNKLIISSSGDDGGRAEVDRSQRQINFKHFHSRTCDERPRAALGILDFPQKVQRNSQP